jgi:hypothetical protein
MSSRTAALLAAFVLAVGVILFGFSRCGTDAMAEEEEKPGYTTG